MILQNLEIQRWAHGGDGVAIPSEGPLEGLVVFVPGGVPGDVVTARVVHKKKRFARAEIREIEAPSPHRREPPCPVQGACGGCPWMVGTAEVQRSSRDVILRGELRKHLRWDEARLDALLEEGAVSGDEWGYRDRVRMAYERSAQGVTMGYRGRGSHRLVPIERCAVASDGINEALEAAREDLGERGRKSGEITLLSHAQGVSWSFVGDDGQPARGGSDEPSLRVAGRPFRVDVEGFSQANAGVTEAIGRHVEAYAAARSGERALELFAGAGTWTLSLLAAGKRVEAYEVDARARDAFLQNTAHGETTFHVADLLDTGVPEPPPGRADLVVLDPPRGGAAPLIPWLRAYGAPHVVMISCDVATACRDLAALAGDGMPYEVEAITPYDMFPHTGHQELVIELSLRSPSSE